MRLILNLVAAGFAVVAGSVCAEPDGQRIYQQTCSVCHGDNGQGAQWGRQSLATPPRDFTTVEARRELSRERMISAVAAGRPGTPMPGFATQLDTAEIAAVVDYVRDTLMRPPAAQAHPPRIAARLRAPATVRPAVAEDARELPLPDGLSGDVDSGRAWYLANCVACHGERGQGDGPRAYFIFPRPLDFRDPAVRAYLNRPNLFRGIRHGVVGREMPAWGKVMTDQQIADIAEFVYREFVED